MKNKLTHEHQKLIETVGIDGETTLKDNSGKALDICWSESGNFIIMNPGGWGDGKFFLTTILYHFLTYDNPAGFCLHTSDKEGCLQWVEASEMEKLRKLLVQRYTHKG